MLDYVFQEGFRLYNEVVMRSSGLCKIMNVPDTRDAVYQPETDLQEKG